MGLIDHEELKRQIASGELTSLDAITDIPHPTISKKRIKKIC